jgi:hypothetical protein
MYLSGTADQTYNVRLSIKFRLNTDVTIVGSNATWLSEGHVLPMSCHRSRTWNVIDNRLLNVCCHSYRLKTPPSLMIINPVGNAQPFKMFILPSLPIFVACWTQSASLLEHCQHRITSLVSIRFQDMFSPVAIFFHSTDALGTSSCSVDQSANLLHVLMGSKSSKWFLEKK